MLLQAVLLALLAGEDSGVARPARDLASCLDSTTWDEVEDSGVGVALKYPPACFHVVQGTTNGIVLEGDGQRTALLHLLTNDAQSRRPPRTPWLRALAATPWTRGLMGAEGGWVDARSKVARFSPTQDIVLTCGFPGKPQRESVAVRDQLCEKILASVRILAPRR